MSERPYFETVRVSDRLLSTADGIFTDATLVVRQRSHHRTGCGYDVFSGSLGRAFEAIWYPLLRPRTSGHFP